MDQIADDLDYFKSPESKAVCDVYVFGRSVATGSSSARAARRGVEAGSALRGTRDPRPQLRRLGLPAAPAEPPRLPARPRSRARRRHRARRAERGRRGLDQRPRRDEPALPLGPLLGERDLRPPARVGDRRRARRPARDAGPCRRLRALAAGDAALAGIIPRAGRARPLRGLAAALRSGEQALPRGVREGRHDNSIRGPRFPADDGAHAHDPARLGGVDQHARDVRRRRSSTCTSSSRRCTTRGRSR
jgi:hypothetical protein